MTRARPLHRFTQVARSVVCAVAALACLTLTACQKSGQTPRAATGGKAYDEAQAEAVFAATVDNLSRLGQFDDPEPTLQQTVSQLNQWRELGKAEMPTVDEPLLDALPADLREAATVASGPATQYTLDDALALAEAVWLRSIVAHAALDPPTKALTVELTANGSNPTAAALARAVRLFDWVDRNIALDIAGNATPRHAWQALVAGHGTAADRATVFMLLARQQGLETAVLVRPDATEKPLLVAVVVPAATGDAPPTLYVFDMVAGVPWPGPGGKGVATLADAAADPAILAQLDLAGNDRYPWQAGDLSELTALIDASPAYVNPRLRAFENNLSGNERLVLHCDTKALVAQLERVPQIAKVALWDWPYRALAASGPARSPLGFKALVGAGAADAFVKPFAKVPDRLVRGRLQQLTGALVGEDSATVRYQAARPSAEQLAEAKLSEASARALAEAKHSASYWLGLLAYEHGNYPAAADYFGKRTPEALPDGRWRTAAERMLARSLEAQGQAAEAAALYEADTSATKYGSLLRARRLRGAVVPDEKPGATAPATSN